MAILYILLALLQIGLASGKAGYSAETEVGETPLTDYQPGIFIGSDAGSGGTRTHVMVLDNKNGVMLNPTFVSKRWVGEVDESGMGDCDTSACFEEYGENLVTDSMADAIKSICKDHVDACKGAQWVIRATAGMRDFSRKGGDETEAWTQLLKGINSQLDAKLQEYEITVSGETAEGWKEALFDWKGISKMKKDPTPVVLDCGGASNQFAFPITNQMREQHEECADLKPYQQIILDMGLAQKHGGSMDAELKKYYFNEFKDGDTTVTLGSFLAGKKDRGDGDDGDDTIQTFNHDVDANTLGGLKQVGGYAMAKLPACKLRVVADGQPLGASPGTGCNYETMKDFWDKSPFARGVKDAARDYRKCAATAGLKTYAFANFAQLKDGGPRGSGMGLTDSSTFQTLLDIITGVVANKHLDTDTCTLVGRAENENLCNALDHGLRAYLNLPWGDNAVIVAAFFYYMFVELYGYDPNTSLAALDIEVIKKEPRHWVRETNDSLEETNWIPGLVEFMLPNPDANPTPENPSRSYNFYTTLEKDIQALQALL